MHLHTPLFLSALSSAIAVSARAILPPQNFTTPIGNATTIQQAIPVRWPEHDMNCGGTYHNIKHLSDTFALAMELQDRGIQLTGINRVDYPHYFGAGEFSGNMPLCAGESAPYEEFPLLKGEKFNNYDSPGADRVVFKSIGFNYYLYCGAITHTGAPNRNAFVLCT